MPQFCPFYWPPLGRFWTRRDRGSSGWYRGVREASHNALAVRGRGHYGAPLGKHWRTSSILLRISPFEESEPGARPSPTWPAQALSFSDISPHRACPTRACKISVKSMPGITAPHLAPSSFAVLPTFSGFTQRMAPNRPSLATTASIAVTLTPALASFFR